MNKVAVIVETIVEVVVKMTLFWLMKKKIKKVTGIVATARPSLDLPFDINKKDKDIVLLISTTKFNITIIFQT